MVAQSPWNAFSAFQVLGDHTPKDGYLLAVRIAPDARTVDRIVEDRASDEDNLDPAFARMMMRAGVGLISTGAVSFVYANPNETLVLMRSELVSRPGATLQFHDMLVSTWSSRMALISGLSIPVVGRVYELPDIAQVRKLVRACIDHLEESTPLRTAHRLGVQLRGRGEPFHDSMIDTIEEQTSLLEHHQVDMDALPTWWWRGIAAKLGNPSAGEVEIWSELPATDEIVAAIV